MGDLEFEQYDQTILSNSGSDVEALLLDAPMLAPIKAETPEEALKRQQRLERNREIARNCRKRKRERTSALMEEVTRLREINAELELKLKVALNKLGKATSGRGNRGKDEEKRRLEELNRMGEMLKQRCSDDEVKARMKVYTQKYSDFGEERKNVVRVHLEQLEQLFLPTQISKMLIWLLQHDDEFYTSKDPSSIWNTLTKELKLDESQIKELLAQRALLGAQSSSMKSTLKKLKNLWNEFEANMDKRRQQFQHITSVISPSQCAKFLLWVERNQACIHLLDNMWNVKNDKKPVAVD